MKTRSVTRITVALLALRCGVAAPALAAQPSTLLTNLSLLVGRPTASQPGAGRVLVLPGTVIVPQEKAETPADAWWRIDHELRATYRLEELEAVANDGPDLQIGVERPMPGLPGRLDIRVTLLGFDDARAAYRVRLAEADKLVAEPTINVARGQVAVVGGRDGDAAPYFFLVVQPWQPYTKDQETITARQKGLTAPRLIEKVKPEYPEAARLARTEGAVVLQATIGTDGKPYNIRPIFSKPNGLTEAAIEGVRKWRYEPARDASGKPVDYECFLTVSFWLPPEGTGASSSLPADGQALAIIDALVHTSFDNQVFAASKVTFSKKELAAEMRRNHVVGAVAMNRPGDPYVDLSDLNIVNCADVVGAEDAGALEHGLAAKEYRCITVFLGFVNRYASDPAYEPAYQLAEKYHVPVVFCFGGSAAKYTEPRTVDPVARSHPRVTFVLAHAADPRTIAQRARDEFLTKSDPYHFFSFANETVLAAEVAHDNPNVVLDGSGLLIGDLTSEGSDQLENYLVKPVRAAFVKLGDPSKLMFATGWPVTAIGPYLEAFKRAIPPESWQAVFHDNAVRVYGFGAASPPR